MKARGQKIAALTAYDFPMANLLDEVGVPLILVGDSVGMVVLGYTDTTLVTMAEMEHHVRAAARAPSRRALLAAHLPYHSYESVNDALANALRLVAAGAEAVKAEGGRAMVGNRCGPSSRRAFPVPRPPRHVAAKRAGRKGGYHVKGKVESGTRGAVFGRPDPRGSRRSLQRKSWNWSTRPSPPS